MSQYLHRGNIWKFAALGLIVAFASGIVYRQFHKIHNSDESASSRMTSLGVPTQAAAPKSEVPVLMNDPAISKSWGLMHGESGSDIRADRAWAITQGSKDIKVAVIDTGADVNHPDLNCNIWRNPGETGFDAKGKDRSNNQLDDDGNGFVDDVYGWNFDGNNNDLADHHGHGTHISGIIGACGGNGIGISGVSPHVSIIVLKYYDPRSAKSDNLANTVKAIHYAIKMGANIINYSGGGLDFSQDEYAAVKLARDKGILFVAAAGNEYSNSDQSHYYPANYKLDNIISVTAINQKTQVLKSSNFGMDTVHIAAPGENIFSLLPNNKYGTMTGTSQATAFVSGVAALIMAENREMNYSEVRNQILDASDEVPDKLAGKTKNFRKLNSYKALAIHSKSTISGMQTVANTADQAVFSPSRVDRAPNQVSQQISQLSGLMEAMKTAGGSAQPALQPNDKNKY
jgi:thermitase